MKENMILKTMNPHISPYAFVLHHINIKISNCHLLSEKDMCIFISILLYFYSFFSNLLKADLSRKSR